MFYPGPSTSLLVGRLVIYIWHALSASERLAVAISCIALAWCGSELDHVTRVSGHVCDEVVFRTCLVNSRMMFGRTIHFTNCIVSSIQRI